MRLILQYFRRNWLFAVLAPLMMLVEVFMDLTLPAIMADIVDSGISSGSMDMVLHLGLRMIAVTFIGVIGGMSCSYFSSLASTGLGADLRQDLYERVLALSAKNIDRFEAGRLITRLTNDVSQLEDVSRMMLRIMVRSPFLIVGSLAMSIYMSRNLSTLYILLIPLLLVSVTFLIRRAFPLFSKVQERLDRINTRLRENLAGKRLVKAFVREDFEIQKFGAANQELTEVNIRAMRTMAFTSPVMQLLLNGGIIAALWFGARQVDITGLQLGSLIAFINYLRQLLFSLMMLSQIIMRFSRAQASSVRIREVLDEIPDIAPGPDKTRTGSTQEHSAGRLEFRDVSFAYNQHSDPVLKSISFTVEPGQQLAIVGATGSGKSTLARLIPRLYDVSSGQILLDGIDIRELDSNFLRRNIALVPQQTILFSGNIRDNILYGYNESRHGELESLMTESARTASISAFIEGLPDGYGSNVNQKGVNLSGGQKQRVAIARALAKNAPVIILDDATSAVDMKTESAIFRSLEERPVQPTRIIIAQRISTVMAADKIIILEDGQMTGMGNHDELLETNQVYREIYFSQVDREVLS